MSSGLETKDRHKPAEKIWLWRKDSNLRNARFRAECLRPLGYSRMMVPRARFELATPCSSNRCYYLAELPRHEDERDGGWQRARTSDLAHVERVL